MQKNIRRKASDYVAKNRRHRAWTKVVSVLACLVVFCTTYALILPALTLTAPTVLDCTYETLGVHVHTPGCYDQEGNLTCGYADFVVHTHDASCYDAGGDLICTLPVIEAHTHTQDCFVENYVLTCGLEESEGHIHTDDCYQDVLDEEGNVVSQELICGLEESEGRTHTDACYTLQLDLVCGKEEVILHTHTADCYDEYGNLTCGQLEVLEHAHNDYCFVPVEEPEEAEEPEEPEQPEELPEEPEAAEEPEQPEEAEEPEEEPETAVEPEPVVLVPAQVFRGQSGGVVVNVNAPEGAFPDKTVMSVSPASDEAVQAAADALDTDASNVQAVDITFRTSEGVEIEPAVPVYVTMQSALVAQAGNTVVVHVDDNAQAQIVEDTSTGRTTVTFEADAFSVYAIVPETDARYIYEFYVAVDVENEDGTTTTANELVETQIITGGDILTRPEVPDIPSQYSDFVGWYIGGSKNDTGVWDGGTPVTFGALDGDDLKAALDTYRLTAEYEADKEADSNAANIKVIKIHARFADKVTVTFMVTQQDKDDPNENIIQQIVTTKTVVRGGRVSISDVTATPPDKTLGFMGWSYKSKDEDRIGNLIEDRWIAVDKDTTLYAAFDEGHTLTFDNGEGATYTTSQFVASLKQTVEPGSEPLRQGYSFDGWYTAETGGEQFVFGSPLIEDTTIYARWTPEMVNYTVVIWKQRVTDEVDAEVADKHYDYEESFTLTATTGTLVTVGDTYKTLHSTSASSTQNDYTGFTFGRCDNNKVVAGDGSTILNVYYDRNVISFTFSLTDQNNAYVLAESSGTTSGNTVTYNGQTYAKSVTYRGLYESDLNFSWPSQYLLNNSLTDIRWCYTKTGSTSSDINKGTVLNFVGAFVSPDPQSNSITLYYYRSTTTTRYTLSCYQETLDGQWNLITTAVLGTGTVNIQNKYTGFEAYQYSTDNGQTWQSVGSYNEGTGNYSESFSQTNASIRYKRKTYTIDFYNGDKCEKQISKVYGADLSEADMLDGSTLTYTGVGADYYTFAGWYEDSDCTVPIAFDGYDTMPANNLVAYAKWEPLTVTVTYHAEGGKFWSDPDEIIEERTDEIPYNTTAYDYNLSGSRGEVYTFHGWFYDDPEYGYQPWDFTDPVTSDMDLYAEWYTDAQVNIVYKVKVKDADTGEDTWQEIEAVSDSNIYLDGADVAVLPYETTENFVGWRLGVKSTSDITEENANQYNDMTGTFYVPGDLLTVSEEADLADGPEHDKQIVLYAVYYTPPTAELIFDANHGAFENSTENWPGSYNDDYTTYTLSDLINNGGVDLDTIPTPVWPGHTFLGWSTSQHATKAEFVADGTDNREIAVDNDNALNILYAAWTFDLTIAKVDTTDTSKRLNGAEFVLWKTVTNDDSISEYYYDQRSGVDGDWPERSDDTDDSAYKLTTATVDGIQGVIVINDLPDGTYTLKEIKAPDGYILMDNEIIFTITNGSITDSSNAYDPNTGILPVTNSAGTSLPNTGGVGVQVYIYSGLFVMAAAVVFECIVRRKRERGQQK